MKLIKIVLSVIVGGVLSIFPVSAKEISNDELIKEIKATKVRTGQLEKGLSQKDEEIAEIRKEKEANPSDDRFLNWLDKVTLSGAIELDYSYSDDSDPGDNTVNDSTSDLDIGTIELGAEIAFHEIVTGKVVVKGENLDEDDNIFCDEATISIQKQGFPLYFIGGRRGQPFGVFESHFISDPLTQELYEIADTGATLGFTPGVFGLDISATVYQGEVLMAHMLEGVYGLDRTYLDSTLALPGWRTGGMSTSYAETNNITSFIGNITLEPMEGLVLAAFYNSEPGDNQRNNTLGGSFHFEISRLILDIEYITALQRERDSVDYREHKESAMSGAIAFQCTDKLEAALRYEVYDDDIPGTQDGHLENRYGLGLSYNLFEKGNFVTSLMAEIRQSNFEKLVGSAADDSLTEFLAKLAIEF